MVTTLKKKRQQYNIAQQPHFAYIRSLQEKKSLVTFVEI